MNFRKISVCLLLMFMLTACNNTADKKTETETDEVAVQSEEAFVDLDNLKEGEYRISDIPGKITVGEQYNVYSLDNEFTEEMCASNSVTSEQIQKLLNMKSLTGINMYIEPVDKPMANAEFEITVKVKEKEYEGVENLKDVSDVEFGMMAQALVMGFGQASGAETPSYEVYENNNTKWIVFNIKTMGYETRYATIINGRMVYVIGTNTNEAVTEEQNRDIKTIIDSLEYVAD